MQEDHPDVDIFVAALDGHLNSHGYIVPGLGDAETGFSERNRKFPESGSCPGYTARRMRERKDAADRPHLFFYSIVHFSQCVSANSLSSAPMPTASGTLNLPFTGS